MLILLGFVHRLLVLLMVVPLFLSCAIVTVRNSSQKSRRIANVSDFQDGGIDDRITEALRPQVGKASVGAIVAIYDRGKLRFLSFGETVRSNGVPPTADTFFEIGSITKTFTGLMLSRSIDLKRVSATSTLDQFRDEWKKQRTGSISLLELITHRSGLPRLPCDLQPTDARNPYADYAETALVQGLTDAKMSSVGGCDLASHPTAEINYSNWGVATLGYVLSLQQKKSYESLLHDLVLDPLRLRDTAITLRADQIERFARGYDESLAETPRWERKILFGNGAIRSSARDLMTYAVAHLHPEQTPIALSIRRAIQTIYTSPTQRIAYGWFVTPSGNILHNGMTGGFSSFVKIYPKRDLAVLYLTNTARELACFVEAVERVPCSPHS